MTHLKFGPRSRVEAAEQVAAALRHVLPLNEICVAKATGCLMIEADNGDHWAVSINRTVDA